MNFKDYKQEGQKLGISQGNYFKLERGENKIRILCAPEPSISHFLGSEQGSVQCVEGCLNCKNGIKQSVKIMLYVLDRKDETIKLAELPWSVYKAMGELAQSSEYGFETLPPYDLVIIKTGEGMETRYQVTPGRNEEPISREILDKLAAKKPVLEILEERKAKVKSPLPVDDMPPEMDADLPF